MHTHPTQQGTAISGEGRNFVWMDDIAADPRDHEALCGTASIDDAWPLYLDPLGCVCCAIIHHSLPCFTLHLLDLACSALSFRGVSAYAATKLTPDIQA